METLNEAMKKHNINLSPPSTYSSSSSKGKGHALLATSLLAYTSIEPEWILDSGASHHMVNDKSMFTSLDASSGQLEWDEAMNEEYCSLLKNDTWDLFPLPKGRNIV
eukprot:Gb_22671 [translate_table: standard]